MAEFSPDVDNTEKCRRLIDLFLVSVLLDAGAGTAWSYKSTESGRIYRRSEGIAVASLEMYKTVSCFKSHGALYSWTWLTGGSGHVLWKQGQQVSS
jgi:hypothetical protein